MTERSRTDGVDPRLSPPQRVRYAVVGLGHIAQVAVLPAFEHAEDCELAALVSGDDTKLTELSARYGVSQLATYEGYDALLSGGDIDAVYIALPNHMHCEYAVRAARAGVHVLCEKPMAVTEDECRRMIEAADDNRVKLMIAYRLHYEEANLYAADLVRSGVLGESRLFDAVFTMNVRDRGNIRLQADKGGGTLYDIGIYCINAARYLFGAEPIEVTARVAGREDDPRFDEVEELASVVLRFPGERLASFTTCFGAASVESYRVVGTDGSLRLEPAFSYTKPYTLEVDLADGGPDRRTFEQRDQFAPQLERFARCILNDDEPEPDGNEGLIDVRIIEAAYRSARQGRPVALQEMPPTRRPRMEQAMKKPPVEEKPDEVHASGPRSP